MTNILIGGDLYVKRRYKVIDTFNLFDNSDFSILNLEAPVLNSQKKIKIHKKTGPNLVQEIVSLDSILSTLNISYLVGANNHIYDYGKSGIVSTIKYLNSKNISFTGFGVDVKNAMKPMTLTESNIIVLSVAEEEFGVASSNMSGSFSIYGDEIIKLIKSSKRENKTVIVCPHGGGEEVPLPSMYVYSRYREIIDAGADIIVAHHPHVPQGYEVYKGKHIFYSLGNFIHDSYHKSWGLLLDLAVGNNKISVKIYASNVNSGKLEINKLNTNQLSYLNKINSILSVENDYNLMLQAQSTDMYQDYYNKYVERILNVNKRKWFTKKLDIETEENRELLFLNLLRNRSHSEFIERALKIKYTEIVKEFDTDILSKYFFLKKYIKSNFK